jgi:hypothetical protein
VPQDAEANPFNPWVPAIPPAFVGRTSVLTRLQAAVDEGEVCLSLAIGAFGKSSVLNTLAQKLQTRRRTVRVRSGNAREGASPTAFVECVTGICAGDSVSRLRCFGGLGADRNNARTRTRCYHR